MRRRFVLVICVIAMILLTSCSSAEQEGKSDLNGDAEKDMEFSEKADSIDSILAESEQLAREYQEIYEKAKERDALDGLDTISGGGHGKPDQYDPSGDDPGI